MAGQITVLISWILSWAGCSQAINFTYNGFQSSNLFTYGAANVTSKGLLILTNSTENNIGSAFYPSPITFKATPSATWSSFSTTFVFAIRSNVRTMSGHGIAFAIAPSRSFPAAGDGHFLGLFNSSTNRDPSNHIFAVEIDTILDKEFSDIDKNHVGIDINGLRSVNASSAGYHDPDGKFTNVTLKSQDSKQLWVDYDGQLKLVTVKLAQLNHPKPEIPLLTWQADLSTFLLDSMYVGFTSSTGATSSGHYILGWSFSTDGAAPPLSKLPETPRVGKKNSAFLIIILPVILSVLVLCAAAMGACFVWRRRRFSEVHEDWEREYGPQRFSYKKLHASTKGFSDLLGRGGFGGVYRGKLAPSNEEIAVKKMAHESGQGMREFLAEIASLGRLRHRNVVRLLGYCRRKRELLLVYDYMPKGSLDRYLHYNANATLSWERRFNVVKNVAAGLCYLHEGWEKTVVHRDVKASNVLLDGDYNAKLGDFGLARLYDHGTDPQTTHVIGTLGYLAPEHTRTGKATTCTDVFAFGAFLLEVACGRRPTDGNGPKGDMILADWVFFLWAGGEIVEARDPKMGMEFVEEEVRVVLTVGLMCLNPQPKGRPLMKHVVQFLEGDVPLPPLTFSAVTGGIASNYEQGFDEYVHSNLASLSFSSMDMSISGGR